MTPLAQRLAKQLLLKPSDRPAFWAEDANARILAQSLAKAQFFEVSQVLELLPELRGLSEEWFEAQCFTPAPHTWIEFNHPSGRAGLFASKIGDGRSEVHGFWDECAGRLGWVTEQGDYEVDPTALVVPTTWKESHGKRLSVGLLGLVHWLSVIINSPKVIDRKEHSPHKGMQRRVKDAGLSIEVRGWTELLLQVTPHAQGGDGKEGALTGKKCLHFCRSFLRIRNGRLERVTAHWRGDAALGIKRKSYVVA